MKRLVAHLFTMKSFVALPLLLSLAVAAPLEDCPGYKASNIVENDNGLKADLSLSGEPCNVYGDDLPDLKLLVEHQTGEWHHDIARSY